MCFCCSPDIRTERAALGLNPCKKFAAARKVGVLTFEHKTGGSLTIGDSDTIAAMVRNDRRRDPRLMSTRNKR